MTYDSETGMNFNRGQGADARLIVEFSQQARENGYKSSLEGRTVYDDVEMVTIIIPGDKHSEVIEAVTDDHRQRWPVQYRLFKEGLEQVADGMPIKEWPPLTPAQVKTLESLNIRTVEQLAGLSDTALTTVGMGGRQLRDKAAAWLQNAADGKPLAEALAAREQVEAKLQAQDAQIAEMQAVIRRLEAQVPVRHQEAAE